MVIRTNVSKVKINQKRDKKKVVVHCKKIVVLNISEYFRDKQWKNMSRNLPNPSLQSIKQHWWHCFQSPVQGTDDRFLSEAHNVFVDLLIKIWGCLETIVLRGASYLENT